jgi:hypothetical protein
VLLIGFWLAAVMVWRERPWREVAVTAVVLVLCVAVAAVAPAVLRASGLPVPGSEYDAGGILRYFSVVQFSDWRRMLFVVLPGGIVPALALLAWRSHDEVARALSLVTAAYFLFFFVQAHVALHHFVPAMVLPLAVFWRLYWRAGHRSRRRALALAGVAGVTAFWLSLPKDATPYIAPVAIGRAVDDRMGGYEGGDPRAYARAELLSHALPYDWDPQVPERSLGGSPLVWRYYTARARAWNETDHAPAYVIQPLADPAPADSVRVADDDEAALYVTDPVTHASHVALRPPTPAGSRVYEIRRGILFRSEVLESGPRVINVRDVLEHWGVPLPGRFRSTGSDE